MTYIKSDAQRAKESAQALFTRQERKRSGLCPTCGRNPFGPTTFNCTECTAKNRAANTRTRDTIKRQVFEKYGGAFCLCCGESHLMFLTIDHIHENGAEHRRQIFGDTPARRGRGTGGNMYTWLRARKYPDGYQVLCFNCNVGKHLNGGTCPHQATLHAAA